MLFAKIRPNLIIAILQQMPELPRHKLRVVEKLGEGGFGMVSSITIAEQWLQFVHANSME